MIECYNCGKQVDDGTLICPECGALVKRYTAPPRREPEAQQNWQQPQQTWQQPGSTNVPPYQMPYTKPQPKPLTKGKLPTGFCVWLWLCVIGLSVFLYSFLYTGFVLQAGNEQSQLLVEMFYDMGLDLNALENGPQLVASFLFKNAVIVGVAIVLELVLFFVRSRRALLVNLIGSMVLAAVSVFVVGLNIVCVLILIAAVGNNLALRKYLPYLKR